MENTNLTGYSRMAQDPQFRKLFADADKKSARKSLVKSIVFLILTAAAVIALVYANSVSDMEETLAWVTVASFVSIPVFAIFFIINVINTALSYAHAHKVLDPSSVDCIVSNRQQWESKTTDEYGYDSKKDTFRITLETDEGKKIKITDNQARMVLPYVSDGDKVRYHKGFTYPIELFDKSKGNICVFCGAHNDAKNRNCEKCQKPMLI